MNAALSQPAAAESVPQTAVEKPAEVKRFHRYVVRESFLFASGELDSYLVTDYISGSMLPREERLNDSSDILLERTVNTYSGTTLMESITSGSEGEILSVERFYYDEAGNLAVETVSDEFGEIRVQSRYEYDTEGRKTSWIILDSEDDILGITEYSYDGKRVSKVELRDPSGILEEYLTYTYDSEGRLVKEETFLPGGRLEGYVEYLYRDGLPAETRYYRGTAFSRSIVYSEEPAEDRTVVEYRGADGTLDELRVLEYVQIERTER